MNKKVDILKNKNIGDFNSIEEYLLHTYGEKKLKQSKTYSSPTFLDVIGYTLNKRGFEAIEGTYYELDEIEDMMINKWDEEAK